MTLHSRHGKKPWHEPREAELKMLREENARLRAQISTTYQQGREDERKASLTLRRNYARHLAPAYLLAPSDVAKACDEQIDQSGELLDYVREEAAAIRSAKP